MIVGFTVSLIIHYSRQKRLTEAQKNPRLHFFVFDHFMLRWLPVKFRLWARAGLENPDLIEKQSQVLSRESVLERKTSSLSSSSDEETF